MQRWNKYTPQEFCFIVLEVFDPLVIMGRYCTPKPEVVNRIEEFLNLRQVLELKAHMVPYASENSQRSEDLIRALLEQDPDKISSAREKEARSRYVLPQSELVGIKLRSQISGQSADAGADVATKKKGRGLFPLVSDRARNKKDDSHDDGSVSDISSDAEVPNDSLSVSI